MSLDLGETVAQLDRLSQSVRYSADAREKRLAALLEAVWAVPSDAAQALTKGDTGRPFLAAQATDVLLGNYPPPDPPADWTVAAVDGSHIDVDRHLPVHCYLLNFGGCVLTYGTNPDATLFSRPYLSTQAEELYISDPNNPTGEEAVSGSLLGLVRTVKELQTLADTVEGQPTGIPVLALIDGSLVMWGLSGQAYRPFVRDAIVRDGLLPALDRFEALAAKWPVALAAYISFPRSTEVVNAFRCVLCPHSQSICSNSCNNRRSTLQPCSEADEFLDRDVFQRILAPGWRSPVYRTNSSVPRDHYGERNQINFFYINAGEEIGRVEVPAWVAENEALLSLAHGLVWDQCRRGQGYPVAISESHEQAVINAGDRRVFRRMLIDSLERQGVPAATSEKDRSKRTPWL
jgi:hypothetical protein